MANKKKLIYALSVNLIIVILEIIALFLSIENHGSKVFQFYTEDSNYFSLIVSSIFCIYAFFSLKTGKDIPNWVHLLRYTSTVCLSLTFIVISFVLGPLYPDNFVYWMFIGSGLFHHTICPILSILSFVLFEKSQKLCKSSIALSLVPTLVYGVICIILNFMRVISGPYPFFFVYDFPWYALVFSLAGITLCTLTMSFIYYKINNRKSRAN